MPKRILFAVLDWGLGHATRSAAVAECLIEREVDVVFCSSGRALDYLRQRFPAQEAVKLALPEIRYGRQSATPAIFRRALMQSRQNRKEHRRIGTLVREFKPGAVVSDNLYGAWSPEVPSALITHQLSLPAPIFRKAVNKEMAAWLANFTEVWIPDSPDGLAGALAENTAFGGTANYLGNLSRLSPVHCEKTISCTAVLSGPEPQRSIFEREVVAYLAALPGKKVLIRGVQGAAAKPLKTESDTEVIDFADGETLSRLLCASAFAVCRAGFSTLSDLVRLGVRAVVTPTPGQYEQAYLAERCEEKGWFMHAAQRKLHTVSPADVIRTQPPEPGVSTLAATADAFLNRM